jgi:hypothetical protein
MASTSLAVSAGMRDILGKNCKNMQQHECIYLDLVFSRRSYLYLEEMAVSEGILAVKIEGRDVT